MVKELNSIPVRTSREMRIGTMIRTRTQTTRMKICATVNVWAHHIGFNKSTSVVVHGSRGGMTLGQLGVGRIHLHLHHVAPVLLPPTGPPLLTLYLVLL